MWIKGVASKLLVHPWRLTQDRLPTLHNLSLIRGVMLESSFLCPRCREEVDTTTHLFFECKVFSRVWYECLTDLVLNLLCIYNNCKHHYVYFCGLPICVMDRREQWCMVWFASIWSIWLARYSNF